MSRPPGHPGATRATPGAARVSRRTLILAGVALAAVLALIVVASILSDRAEPTSAPGRVSDPGGRFYLSSWSIPETAKAGQSFRVTMQVAEDTARAALAQSLSVEAAGSEWGRQTLTPGEGSTREVVVFARIDTPGTYVVTVRIDGIAAGQRAIVVTR